MDTAKTRHRIRRDMYGLRINRLYLEEILDGKKDSDARPFSTHIRGRIALLDNKECRLYGFADLVAVHSMKYEEFRRWQGTKEFQIPYKPEDEGKRFYSYEFNNVRRIAKPLKVSFQPAGNVWVVMDNRVLKQATEQVSLDSFGGRE